MMRKIWVSNGYEIHRINECEFELYQIRGFSRGKKKVNSPQVAWNKGLTKEDNRVASYVEKKPEKYNKPKAIKQNGNCSLCKGEIKMDYNYCPYCGKKFI